MIQWARGEERLMRMLMMVSLVIVVGALVSILGVVAAKGLPALSWEMVSQPPRGGYYLGNGGGILNAILGSLYLAVGALVLSFLMGLPLVLYMNVYMRRASRRAGMLRFALDVLWGVPSIVYGACGFTLAMAIGLKASLGAGMITVAVLMLPIMTRTMDELVRTVPTELREASYALGATPWEMGRILLRQVAPGLATALLLALGRGIGDTASVLFTAGFTDALPTSLVRPAATLPLSIFFQLGSPLALVQSRAYAAACILTIMVVGISIVSRLLARKFSKFIIP